MRKLPFLGVSDYFLGKCSLIVGDDQFWGRSAHFLGGILSLFGLSDAWVGFLGYFYKSTKKSWHGSDPTPFLAMPRFSWRLVRPPLPFNPPLPPNTKFVKQGVKGIIHAVCLMHDYAKLESVPKYWTIILDNYWKYFLPVPPNRPNIGRLVGTQNSHFPGSKCSTLTYLFSESKMQPGTVMCFLNFYTLVFWIPLVITDHTHH